MLILKPNHHPKKSLSFLHLVAKKHSRTTITTLKGVSLQESIY